MKKYLADSLSFANLCCGIAAIAVCSQGMFELGLLLVLCGALLDGLDGAAARFFGGTRFGVIADDLADGMTYGLAPGAALYFLLTGTQGIVLGLTYAIFTVSRLIYFTLNKGSSDPNYFSGVPSPTGGVIVMSAVVVLGSYPALVGLLVGAACIFMVSFDTAYRHLGRLFLYQRKVLIYTMPSYLVLFLIGYFYGFSSLIAIILAANLLYALFPIAVNFKESIHHKELNLGLFY